MAEVEIIWPSNLAEERLVGVADELEQAGVATTCRIQPVRRGPETIVMILMSSTVLEPMLKSLFQHIGEDAYGSLRRFIGRIFGRDDDHKGGDGQQTVKAKDAPDVVIFESSTTGAQFLFTPNLPNEALKKALELDPEAEPGRWMWDDKTHSWLRFERLSR
jgi:hypothetical protein